MASPVVAGFVGESFGGKGLVSGSIEATRQRLPLRTSSTPPPARPGHTSMVTSLLRLKMMSPTPIY